MWFPLPFLSRRVSSLGPCRSILTFCRPCIPDGWQPLLSADLEEGWTPGEAVEEVVSLGSEEAEHSLERSMVASQASSSSFQQQDEQKLGEQCVFTLSQISGATCTIEAYIGLSVQAFESLVHEVLVIPAWRPMSFVLNGQLLQPADAPLATWIQPGQASVNITVVVGTVCRVTRHIYERNSDEDPEAILGSWRASGVIDLEPNVPLLGQHENLVPNVLTKKILEQGREQRQLPWMPPCARQLEDRCPSVLQPEEADLPELPTFHLLFGDEAPAVLRSYDVRLMCFEATAEDTFGAGGMVLVVPSHYFQELAIDDLV